MRHFGYRLRAHALKLINIEKSNEREENLVDGIVDRIWRALVVEVKCFGVAVGLVIRMMLKDFLGKTEKEWHREQGSGKRACIVSCLCSDLRDCWMHWFRLKNQLKTFLISNELFKAFEYGQFESNSLNPTFPVKNSDQQPESN